MKRTLSISDIYGFKLLKNILNTQGNVINAITLYVYVYEYRITSVVLIAISHFNVI